MEKFDVHILGCGSALPTLRHWPSSQVINLREKLFMIDCGEGAQVQLRRSRQKFSRLSHIFISHLHGDHIFGLIGLISTLSLAGRTLPLHLFAHAELKTLLQPQLDFFCQGISFEVVFHPLPTDAQSHLIFEDRSVEVYTIPLKHRVPCCGFLFREKPLLPHIKRDMIDYLQIPYYAINSIKQGADWTTAEGRVIPNSQLVSPADRPRSYAYCSDTCYQPQNIPLLRHVDVLYHEATFGQEYLGRAIETLHSTAEQAATIAHEAEVGRLVIGHFSSRYDDESVLLSEAQRIFPQTQLAQEGLVISV